MQKKICTKNIYIYILKNALPNVTYFTRAICELHLCMEGPSAYVFDWNLRAYVASEEAEARSCLLCILHFRFQKAQTVEPRVSWGFRASQTPDSSASSDWKLHLLKFCRLWGESGVQMHLLQEGLAPFWRGLEGGLAEGPVGRQEDRKGGSGRLAERQKQEACCWSRESLSTVQGQRLQTEPRPITDSPSN